MKRLFASLSLVMYMAVLLMGVTAPVTVSAVGSIKQNLCQGAAGGSDTNIASANSTAEDPKCADKPADGLKNQIATITNVLLYIVGAITVVMLIIGGFRYVISQGDSSALTAAKNTILYAVIGLIVVILAYTIVHFVTTNIG